MPAELVVVLLTVAVVGLVVVFHYETIRLLNRWFNRRQRKSVAGHRDRPTILVIMFMLLAAHVVEVWLFGGAFWWLLSHPGYGAVEGYPQVNLLDCIYFSAANYTTVGWGDLSATGHVRFLAGTEALVGFMMVTWSASFGYLIMARTWGQGDD